MHGKDFRPLFSHGVRQLVCHRTNFKLFTHTRTRTHTAAEFSFACVCVFVIWIKLWNSHTHTLRTHSHTHRGAWKILQQTTKGLSESRQRRGRWGRVALQRFLHSYQRCCPTPTANNARPLHPQPALSAALAAVPLRFAFLLLEVCVKALLYLLLL